MAPRKAAAKVSVFDKMAEMSAGDLPKPGDMIHGEDGFVYTVPEPEVVAAKKARATKLRGAVTAAAVASTKETKAKVGLKLKSKPAEPLQTSMTFGGPVTARKTAAAVVELITAWSFSRYKTWFDCPFKAKLKFIDKLPEPGSPAMERGSAIHKMAEDFANGLMRTMPDELAKFKSEFLALKRAKPACEGEWAFTSDWEETGWFAKAPKAAWCRVKTDVFYVEKDKTTGNVIDHKTGKPKDDHAEQLSLYALAAFIKYPQLKVCHAKLWYLDSGDEVSQTFVRAQMDELKAHWNGKVKPMLSDTRFAPKPGNGCRWCHFSKSKNGPCRF